MGVDLLAPVGILVEPLGDPDVRRPDLLARDRVTLEALALGDDALDLELVVLRRIDRLDGQGKPDQ
jgi:hypothetical protein